MNDRFEKFGQKQSWSDFKVLYWYSPEGTKENYEEPQSG
jgi:hypothetical protein